MNPFAPLLALSVSVALAACASPPQAGHGAPPDGAGRPGHSMMDEMCARHAAEPGRAASAPETMMDRHCKAAADAPAGGASHVH
ncbi:hypothetical protein LXT12_17645 [Pelomonas sp. P7]|uniref:Lipoprotein n=1 Tax=Pelomonas caseinilytica TaxID=2906763 RepID=A0ABS8XH53_9BURK|nr:hypothetical protein [Pelomonas sp. P7]MCE4539078.1 hypothetical protein [Pelomonas sp. P7]